MKYTVKDYRDRRCSLEEIGKEIVEVVEPEPSSPKDLVGSYMDVFYKMGGIESLADFAKKNPGKFYDQLLRLLISMEAPKQSMQVNITLDSMSAVEMENLPTNELKLRLLESKK